MYQQAQTMMNLFGKFSFFLLLLATLSCNRTPEIECPIIPIPAHVEIGKGSLRTDKPFVLEAGISLEQQTLIRELLEKHGFTFSDKGGNILRLALEADSGKFSSRESYLLSIQPGQVEITSSGEAGIFYGVQSLIQLSDYHTHKIPGQTIADSPRLGYRGFMLDVARHFFGVEHIKKQMDAAARYKLNRFHWHLTDGAGWRLEIKKYPELTEIAAWRPYSLWKEWYTKGGPYCQKEDKGAYGGYFTAEDVREVLEYAAKLHIEVIPEIEMPGHSEEVTAVYPELACTGEPYTCGELCIGNEKTFEFIENVLLEVMELFPSQYIHVGGDEAETAHWMQCPKCRRRMQSEGISCGTELQAYMMHRVEKFVTDHGKTIIGWDEILDGGLGPNATVMSWRGTAAGIQAASMGHDVIMAPTAHCYLDYYQDAPPSQPEAMPAMLTIEKVYGFDPVPDSLPESTRKHILGVQANLWAERISTTSHAEYMLYPRLLAVAEVAWSQPERKEYTGFMKRVENEVDNLRTMGYNSFDPRQGVGARPESTHTWEHKAKGKPVTYITPYHKKYTAGGDATLTDGLRADWFYDDGRWQGFLDHDMEVVIDLGQTQPIKDVHAEFLQCYQADIWMPTQVEISVSEDGSNYTLLRTDQARTPFERFITCYETFGWEGAAEARYVKYVARVNPHKGAWIFLDEIFVN